MGANTVSTAPKSSNAAIGIVLLVLAVAAVLVYAGVHAAMADSAVVKQSGALNDAQDAPTLTIDRHHGVPPWVPLSQHPAAEN